MKKLILTIGLGMIIIVTIGAFFKNDIINSYNAYIVNKKYSDIAKNDYYLEDNFDYVNNYSKPNIKSRNDLINYIYFAINSGTSYIERYPDKKYSTYVEDLNNLTEDKGLTEVISILNNFVHPYNSSSNIYVSYGVNSNIALTINKVYSEEERKEINKIVDKVITDNITTEMDDREKVKIIHDYIVNNAAYDKLKYENDKDTTYRSGTAYGVLIEGYGICGGYADAMAIFLDELEIINYKISNNEHVWNLVKIGDKWYHLDLTWNDPISEDDSNKIRHTYFLIDTEALKKIDDNVHHFNRYIYTEA